MRRLGLLLAACCAVASCVSAGQTIPAGLILEPGVYRTKWVIPGESRRLRNLCGKTVLQDDKPARLHSVPKFTSAHPRFGWLELDANYETAAEILFALDESKGTGKGYDVIYVDANRNGSLTDERKASAKVTGGRLSCYSAATIPHSVAYPGSKNPNGLAIDVFFAVSGGRIDDGNAYYRGTWTGQMRSNAGSIPFMLWDDNENGLYTDVWSRGEFDATGGDRLLFDWGQSGRFPDYQHEESSAHPLLHSVMSIGGRLYVLKPSPLGDKLQVSSYGGSTGRIGLRISAINGVPVSAIQPGLEIYAGSQVYEIPVDGTPITVPAGRYYADDLAFVPKSVSEPESWFFYNPPDNVTVAKNSTVWITMGGRAKMAFDSQNQRSSFTAGEGVSLLVNVLVGDGMLEMTRGKPEDRPSATVIDSSGTTVDRSLVEDAGGGDVGFMVEIPDTLEPGKYIVNVSWKTGPFGPMGARRQIVLK